MPPPLLDSTASGIAQSVDAQVVIPVLALIIVHCEREPERVGEAAFFPPKTRRRMGRGGEPIEEYSSFDKQRPGDPEPQPLGIVACLRGNSLSREQTMVEASASELTLYNEGQCEMLFNGRPATHAAVGPGDTVTLVGEYVFLCVLRPLVMPPLRYARREHRFGGRDAYGYVGESPAAWEYRDQCAGIAGVPDDVLILGETGTGKEGTAERIHGLSKRASGPLVKRNAANFPEGLLESELFGKLKDYPTPGPAVVGAFPAAKGGTLFLDEAGLISPRAQGALLRALQSGEYQTLGESTVRVIDVRVLAVTNRDPNALVADFRYRLTLRLQVPPVSARREDIPLLIRDILLRRLEKDASLKRLFVRGADDQLYPRISSRLVEYLVRHDLPGNMRNLEAVVARALHYSTGDRVLMVPTAEIDALIGPASDAAPTTAQPSSFPASQPTSSSRPTPSSKGESEREISKEELLAALMATDWNEARAAEELRILRGRLRRLMKKHGIAKP